MYPLFHLFYKKRQYGSKVAGEVAKPSLPADLPILSFVRWGAIGTDTRFGVQRGFFINNHGGPALDVTVESFSISGRKAMANTIDKIAEGEQVFAPIWLDGVHTGSRWELDVALGIEARARIKRKKISRDQTLSVPVSMLFRNRNNLWYRTRCLMTFSYGRIGFSSAAQESLGITARNEFTRR